MRFHLNVHDPRVRQRVLLAGAALGLLAALLWARARGGVATTDAGLVGATTDPTTSADAFPTSSGVPSVLDGGGLGGVTPVTADDVANAVQAGLQGIDWSGMFGPVADAVSSLATAVQAPSVGSTSAPADLPPIDYVSSMQPGTIYQDAAGKSYALQPAGVFQPAYVGPSGDYVSPGTYAGYGVQPQPITSNLVSPPQPISRVARPTSLPALTPAAVAPVAPVARPTAAPPAYTPQTAAVKVTAVQHPAANVTVTHLSNGTVIEQVKGKTPYVVKR